ncbi:hypothetical protein [Candidatus Endomicrobiellum devescovinae]|jgi:hypothetical protein|uniref:hypothetical protein n=1 Tax=Candidatus Endomicrobiellum devescovinae TaxID=3242322 RepID=UPI002824855E|nr:hypothetical protein [Endomicrobium sp.]
MKKLSAIVLVLGLFVNIGNAFDLDIPKAIFGGNTAYETNQNMIKSAKYFGAAVVGVGSSALIVAKMIGGRGVSKVLSVSERLFADSRSPQARQARTEYIQFGVNARDKGFASRSKLIMSKGETNMLWASILAQQNERDAQQR